ncbi:hypothetical protein BDP27DRAFT_1419997 [Rhodocollybia butyracea]|uniref:Uncharacterized protein n=1 Tax=Rhodocollybia butyracea TaxID=206335 RepID=A0A9P5U8V1_9AGAR|nr:hypothetical protein BDP27DRAFT_1419997 [Rhodocollybia butyracea]
MPAVLDVITTTVSPSSSPSSTAPARNGSAVSVPIAAIVGGTLGGAFLAVIFVVAWMIWGRAIKRKREKRERETIFPQAALRITHNNTLKNATISAVGRPRKTRSIPRLSRPLSRGYEYKPLKLWPPSEKKGPKVKFAGLADTDHAGDSSVNTESDSENSVSVQPPAPEVEPAVPLTPPPFIVASTSTSSTPTLNDSNRMQTRTLRSVGRIKPMPSSSNSITSSQNPILHTLRHLSSASSWNSRLNRFSGISRTSNISGASQATSGSSYSQPSLNDTDVNEVEEGEEGVRYRFGVAI